MATLPKKALDDFITAQLQRHSPPLSADKHATAALRACAAEFLKLVIRESAQAPKMTLDNVVSALTALGFDIIADELREDDLSLWRDAKREEKRSALRKRRRESKGPVDEDAKRLQQELFDKAAQRMRDGV